VKSRRTLALAFVGAMTIILVLGFLWRPGTTYHTRSWQRATRLAMGDQLSWWERIYGAVVSKQQPQYWWDQAKRHETELLKMGYLTNCTFRLTNQVMTREFTSNFFRLIHLRVGTNDDQVWRSPHLTNRTGLAPTFPTKDYAIWGQTFRECASLYASNVLPASVAGGAAKGER